MARKNENIVPFMATPPGGVLKMELEERGIKQKDFANAIGMKASNLNELIKGKRSISTEIAIRLQEELNIKATFWLNLQSQYEYDLKVIEDRGIEEKAAEQELEQYNKLFDVSTIIKRLNIQANRCIEILCTLKTMLHLAPPAEMAYAMNGKFRKSKIVGCDKRMVTTWTLLAEYYGGKATVINNYDPAQQDALIAELSAAFHANHNTIAKVRYIMARYGIKFEIVEKVNKASIDGYSFWNETTPTIVVTKRMNSIDSFAFSVMHEVAHIILHNNTDRVFVNYEEDNQDSIMEKEADKFAANALIPDTLWNKLPSIRLTNAYRIQNELTKWARAKHLNEWIVIGRVAHSTGMWKFRNSTDRNIS